MIIVKYRIKYFCLKRWRKEKECDVQMSEYLMYLRKSRQDDPNETVEEVLMKHEIQLQEYALKNFGYKIPDKDIYREVCSAETIQDRPKIQELFKRMEKEHIKGVLVIDSARLTRGDLFDCGTVCHAFMYTSTLVITPTKIYDLNDKYDKKFFEMELTRNSDFLDYTKEILNRGRLASKRRGNWIHTDAPYGFTRVKIGKDWTLKINEAEAIYVRMAFEMYAEGSGCYVIMNKMEELGAKPRKAEHFSEGIIRQMLKNEVYIGKIRIGERSTAKVMENGKIIKKRLRHDNYELVEGKHDKIISEELFYKVQNRRKSISHERPNLELKFIWAGLIKCGKCGKAIEQVIYIKQGVEYRKSRVRCKSLRCCDNMSHNYDEVHDALVAKLKEQLEDFTVKVEHNNQDKIKEHEVLLETLNKQIEDIEKKQAAICEYLESGVYTVDMFVSRNNKLEDEKKRIQEAIDNANIEIPNMKAMHEQLITFHQVLGMLDEKSISAKVKNSFLKQIVKVVYYTKDESGITLDMTLKV